MIVEKPWLKSYPAGVPPEIDLSQYASVVALLENACEGWVRGRPQWRDLDVPSWRHELEKSRNWLAEVSVCKAFEKLDHRRVCFRVDETFRALAACNATSSAPAGLE